MEDDLVKEQYLMLRAQIMQNLNQTHTLLLTSYTLIGLIMAFAMGMMNNPLIYTAVFFILLIVSIKIKALNDTLVRISTYMRIFLEPKMKGMDWETNLNLLYQHKRLKNGPPKKIFSILFFRNNSANLLITILIYCIFLYSLINNFTMQNFIIGGFISTGSLLVILFLTIKEKDHAEITEWEKTWVSLKSELDGTNTGDKL